MKRGPRSQEEEERRYLSRENTAKVALLIGKHLNPTDRKTAEGKTIHEWELGWLPSKVLKTLKPEMPGLTLQKVRSIMLALFGPTMEQPYGWKKGYVPPVKKASAPEIDTEELVEDIIKAVVERIGGDIGGVTQRLADIGLAVARLERTDRSLGEAIANASNRYDKHAAGYSGQVAQLHDKVVRQADALTRYMTDMRSLSSQQVEQETRQNDLDQRLRRLDEILTTVRIELTQVQDLATATAQATVPPGVNGTGTYP
jgi:hypothetical protein